MIIWSTFIKKKNNIQLIRKPQKKYLSWYQEIKITSGEVKMFYLSYDEMLRMCAKTNPFNFNHILGVIFLNLDT